MNSPKIPQQIISLSLLFVLAIVALIVARILFVPHSFGRYGHYRADAVLEITAQQISYTGYQACIDCHDDVYELKAKSNHKGVSCEACHGAAARHVQAPDEFTPSSPRGRGYCPLCHGYDPSRPTGFPQIIVELHNPGKACMSCHDPHDPLLPHAPEECSACHRGIVRQKVASNHTSLECARCHTVPEEHLVNPRFAVAQKPTAREFCGQCHAQEAPGPGEIPRIDLSTHGEPYLCWDCHYPHQPEASR